MLTVGTPVRFEEFYRTGYRRVYRLVWALAGPTAAEELTQDAFLRAHRNWTEVAELDDPLQWVSRVARNLAISRFRRLGAEARALTKLDRPEPVHLSESATDVWEAVRSLPRRQREVVVLCYLEGFTRSKPPPNSVSAPRRSRHISTAPAPLSPTNWRATHDRRKTPRRSARTRHRHPAHDHSRSPAATCRRSAPGSRGRNHGCRRYRCGVGDRRRVPGRTASRNISRLLTGRTGRDPGRNHHDATSRGR
jgi:RNA polymerase sigma-70 factor, ECF subfamily